MQMSDFSDLTSAVVTGAAAGDLTVAGIKLYDILVLVQDLTAGTSDIHTEFTVTADNTINNTGGTSTAAHSVLVVWQRRYGVRHKYEAANETIVKGRSAY